MLVPIASCISQLKWYHFSIRERRLTHLELFDSASRGPWGALVFLCSLRAPAIPAFALACVTIIALGIEPSTQQIIHVLSREAPLNNVTSSIGRADSYQSKGFSSNSDQWVNFFGTANNTDVVSLEAALLNGASGTVGRPTFSCPSPASRCTYDDFSTLGFCASTINMTENTSSSCQTSPGAYTYIDCTYQFPNQTTYTNYDLSLTYNIAWNPGNDDPTHFLSTTGPEFAFASVKPLSTTFGDVSKGPPVEVFAVEWYWCELNFRNATSIRGQLPTQSIDPIRLDDTLISRKTGKNYSISADTDLGFKEFISLAFNQTVSKGVAYSGPQLIHLDYLLYNSNLTQVANNFAAAVTNQIRSADPGDNNNVIMSPGQAFYEETYFHVEWVWASLPLAEIILTVLLLIISIILTRKQSLLKESVTALLFHGLEGWSEADLRVDSPETIEKLSKHASRMKARLAEDGRGHLKFTRGPHIVPPIRSLPITRPKPGERIKPIRTQARAATILPNFVGLKFQVYNGKVYNDVTITEDMVGHKLGEFSPCVEPSPLLTA
ncbi:hypothetical protein GQX73_g7072 [Xylaria multiplex]|uniref:Ribosomal protein S19 n=1 Tax=Xylaria multiplex TaxID=323545 RepID=A0A7C8IQJ3_9PEZI|nr:hypothetical protein GQX73_g7072 [Xylaria multiplex]